MDKINNVYRSAAICIVFAVFLSGCNTASKTYDATTGKKISSTSQDDAVTENLADMLKQCKLEEKEKKEESIEAVATKINCVELTGAQAQEACVNGQFQQGTLMILGIALRESMKANKKHEPTCHEQVAAVAIAYFGKESDQAKAWGNAGLATAIALPAAWLVNQGFKTIETLGTDSGDSYGDVSVNATNSNDPVGGGEGSSQTSRIGGQAITIGSGSSGTDQALIRSPSDKLLNTPNPVSSFDGSGSPSGVVIDDKYDGSGNEGSFF